VRNFIGTIAEKVKNHYRKSGMIDAGGKIKNPLKVKIFIVCMLALPLLQFCIFTIYVNIDGIIMAFQSVNLDTNELEFVGLGNFQKFFKNFVSWDKDTFWHTIGNSFGYWPVTYLISIPLQLAAAYFLYKKVHASGFIIVMIFLPNLIPPAVLAQSFTQMISIRQGPLNEILMRIFGYTTETGGGTTTYIYTLRYRVRLQNEQIGFIERKEYETNGKTTLKYRVIETVNGKVQVSDQKELEFPIPSVEGYLGELTFLKQDNRGNALAGAEFTLTHSDNCKICRGNGTQVSILPQEAVSGDDGKVSFTGIPSGHSYDLSETKVPDGYSKTGEHYVVTVTYDEVTVQVLGPDYKQTGTWGQNEMGVIVNNTYYALPSTGGSGTQWFTVGGLALVLTAGFGLYRIKRRRRREDTASS